MEELFIYGLLMDLSPAAERLYNEKLDELFMKSSDNPYLLELELMCGNIGESVIFISNHTDFTKLDLKVFRKQIIYILSSIYNTIDIHEFTELSYTLWNRLPGFIAHEEPFLMLSYAGDSLSWGDSVSADKNYKKIFSYYD